MNPEDLIVDKTYIYIGEGGPPAVVLYVKMDQDPDLYIKRYWFQFPAAWHGSDSRPGVPRPPKTMYSTGNRVLKILLPDTPLYRLKYKVMV